jgi:DNA-binding LacI/PurR family transcriptional regulator
MNPAPRAFSSPSKTIGFLVDWLDGAYQSQILEGARDAARDRRVHLLCFAGGMLGNPLRGGARRNATFDLVTPENVDGIILMSGTIGNKIGAGELLSYCERFRELPRVSIAVELPGMASIVVDNRTGIESAITHLIRSHGCRDIAFVRGPQANPEAELRYQVYRSVLESNGIPFDDGLVLSGDFLTASGKSAIFELFRDRGRRPDAIVSANDQMAIGALEALAELRVKVPDEVVVVGFDDIEEARFTSPPLTTVRQPLYEQGREAVRLLLSEVYGGPRGEHVTLHTEFVARRSCRCFTENSRLALNAFPKRASFEAALIERRQLVLADLARAARGGFGLLGAGWEARLISAITADLRDDSRTAFIASVEEALLKLLEQRADFNLFHDVLSALRRHLLGCLEADPERRARAEDLFQDARTLIGQVSERAQAQQKLVMSRWSGALAHAGAALLASFEPQHLASAVAEYFPALSIKSCFLALHNGRSDEPDKIALAFADPEFRELDAASRRRLDLPRWLLDTGVASSFYVATLFSDDRVFGYVLLDLGTREGVVYEALREFLSAAVRGAALNERARVTDAPPAA